MFIQGTGTLGYTYNGQATAAVETIDRKQPGTEARILVHIQLEHTPE